MIRILLLPFALICWTALHAQVLEVTNAPPITPQNLITNIFLGDGVQVLSVNYEGPNMAVGFFKEGQTAVGMDRGLVMTTGRAVTQGLNFGVAEPGSRQASVDNMSNVTDADLDAIAGGVPIHNVTRYTITFIPIADTLRFRYAFASEEYPEFVCSEFNDIFGFFISGPGINGPYQNNAINIARVPGTNLPVTINNVNPGVVGAAGELINCTPPRGALAYGTFYNDNDGSNVFPIYDGITDVFVAEAVVQPCQVYTIKLVICDVSDQVYDSGVFLEAKSFGTGSLNVDVATVSLDGSVAEGCSSANITFSLPNRVESDFPIDFQLIGTAINGVDYEQIPTNLFIPAGDSSVSIEIRAIEDGITEGNELLMIDVQRDLCNRDTVFIVVRDNPLTKPDLGQDPMICPDTPINLDGTIPVVLPPLPTFTNANNLTINPINTPIFSNIQVTGVIPNVLSPNILRSICIDSLSHPWIDDIDVYLITPGGQFIELTTDNGGNGGNGLGPDFYLHTCFTPNAATRINFPGPLAPPSAVPFTGDWLPEGEWSDIWGGPVNGQWRLQLIDDTNSAVGTLHSWTLTFNRTYDVEYAWSPAAGLSCVDCPNPTAMPDQSVEYILRASDSYGCSVSDTIFFDVQSQLPAPELICGTATNNSVSVAWQDIPGAAGYEININNTGWTTPSDALSHLIDGLSEGQTFEVMLRALGMCPGPADTLQCQALTCAPPDLSATVSDASCAGLSNGGVTLSTASGTGTLTFELNNQTNNTGTFSGLAPGLYVASMTDGANCPATVQFTISAPQAMALSLSLADSVACFGQSNGSASVAVAGGTANYTFVWDNGEATATATQLDAGTHTVTVTDMAGCVAESDIMIPQPAALSLSVNATAVVCPGAGNGTATVVPAGGTASYQFVWDALAGNQNGATAQGLSGGNYEVIVTDANGCTAQISTTVAEPAAIQMTTQTTDAQCFGTATGTASATATGGNGAFSFVWSNMQNTAAATGLSAGNYTVIATDAAGCRDTAAVQVNQPTALQVQWQPADPACFGDADGTASATISGGTGIYTITWPGQAPNNHPVRQNLSAGSYVVTVSDANNCTEIQTITLANPPLLSAAMTTSPADCNAAATGSAQATATGGTGAYTYLWSNGQNGPDAANLQAGPISVVVTDANGCTTLATGSITEPTAMTLSIAPADARCFGASDGTATAIAGGGAGNYTYLWSNGQTGPAASGLGAGTYNLVVRDGNNCMISQSFNISQPTALNATTQSVTASCSPQPDGEASVTATGGTQPYTYRWSDPAQQTDAAARQLPPGAYTVTVTDANGCSFTQNAAVAGSPAVQLQLQATPVGCHGGNNGGISATATGGTGAFTYQWSAAGLGNVSNPAQLSAGLYSLTVTDERLCTAIAQADVTQPAPLTLSAATQHVACAGNATGGIDLTVSGGTMPYRFAWSTGDNVEDLSQLSSGVFSVTVTDANGCVANLETTVIQTTRITASFSTVRADCYGAATGAASVFVNGGSAPYLYEWSNGGSGAAIQNVPAGLYQLAVTDGLGCRTEFEVVIEQPEQPLTASPNLMPPTCHDEDNGRIELTTTGGTPAYEYSMNGGPFVGNRIFVALHAGVYTIAIKDAKGCLFNTGPLQLADPAPLSVDLGPDVTLQYGDSLRIQPRILGAVEPLMLEWKPRDTLFFGCLSCPEPVIRPLFQRAITLVVTDANGCTAEDLFTVFVVKDPRAFVPTGFTPNGDGMNDRLLVHGRQGTRVLSFRIFDRWGQLLYEGGDFEVNDSAFGWDGTFRGKPVTADTYIWSLTVELQDGDKEILSGETNVIR